MRCAVTRHKMMERNGRTGEGLEITVSEERNFGVMNRGWMKDELE